MSGWHHAQHERRDVRMSDLTHRHPQKPSEGTHRQDELSIENMRWWCHERGTDIKNVSISGSEKYSTVIFNQLYDKRDMTCINYFTPASMNQISDQTRFHQFVKHDTQSRGVISAFNTICYIPFGRPYRTAHHELYCISDNWSEQNDEFVPLTHQVLSFQKDENSDQYHTRKLY